MEKFTGGSDTVDRISRMRKHGGFRHGIFNRGGCIIGIQDNHDRVTVIGCADIGIYSGFRSR